MSNFKKQLLDATSVQKKMMSDSVFLEAIEEASEMIAETLQSNHKILLAGNGGSASDAQHIAAELTGRFVKDRKSLPAMALHSNGSHVTAVANDYGYEHIYSRLIDSMAQDKDTVLLFSTSGNSKNILNAAEKCREKNINCIGLTGKSGGKLKDLCSHIIAVPSDITARIQESHIMIGHYFCAEVDRRLFNL